MKRLSILFTAFAIALSGLSSCEDMKEPTEPSTEQDGTQEPVEPSDSTGTEGPVTPPVPPVTEEDVVPDPASGISVEPVKPDADGSCTIRYNAPEGAELHGYTGDVYIHIGIIVDGEWQYVESDWDVNDDKFKMTPDGTDSWYITIDDIRNFFTLAEPTVPIVKLGMVIRSGTVEELINENGEAYSAKLQTRPDQFVSVTDNKNAYVPFQPDEVVYETMPSDLMHGINYTGSNEVTLVFYDKDKNGQHYDYCYVVGDFSNWERKSEYAMKRDDAAGCWWTTVTVDDPDKEYRFQYRLAKGDEELRVQDPYSEIYYHGDDTWITSSTYPQLPSYPESGARNFIGAFRINKPSYSWQYGDYTVEDEDNLVIYELLLRDFTSTGDLNGAIARLDYLKTLGINAIELMPVQEFEGNDSWGYSPVGYFALDKAYGTREMYKRFIDECHGRGIAVIFDVVYNHTTGSHPYAKLYWNGSDNVSDNNPWYNVITPHGFGVYQDLDHENEMVKEHINRSLVYLLEEYNIDGFRFDLTKGFTNNSGMDSSYDAERVNILTGYYNTIKAADPDAVVILEHFVDDENFDLGNSGMKVWRNMNNAYCQSAMGYSSESSFEGLEDINYEWAEFGTYVGFMESHDEERMGYKQTAYGNAGGSNTGNGTSSDSWGIVGRGGNWNDDKIMTEEDGMYVAYGINFTADDEFKFRANKSWDLNYGAGTEGTVLEKGKVAGLSQGGQNIKVAAGIYDVWFNPLAGAVWMMSQGQKPAAPYGIVGTLNGWGTDDDIALKYQDNGYYIAYDVTFSASDFFKIRTYNDGTWNNASNYGAATKGAITTNGSFSLTLGGDSQDMSVPAGTYDIWFSPSACTVHVMSAGTASSINDGSTGEPEDPHTVYMRRLGLNAAFFLTVPGPKMIWQFGELGYDYSINYPSLTEDDRTSRKPACWEYLDDPARKELYDTYCALLGFRNENPEFFKESASFRWYVSGSHWPGRYIFNTANGKNMAIFGNFGSGSQVISVELPHNGTWYNYFNRDEVWNGANHAPTLKEGEFVFLVDWK